MSAPLSSIRDRIGVEDRILLAFVAAAGGFTLAYRGHAASPVWIPAALAALAFATWHGAYDAVLAEPLLQPRFATGWRLPFYAGYLALAAAVLALWWLAPVVALVAFLLYSAFHFGTESHPAPGPVSLVSAAALGFVPIAAACHWSAASVVQIFTLMLRGREHAAERITTIAGAVLVPLLCVALLGVLRQRPQLLRRSALLAALLLLFRLCPPVLAFALFFCLWHTPEHLLETSRNRAGRFDRRLMGRNLRRGIAPWLLSLAAVAVAAWGGRHEIAAYLGVVFIALSALTVPHMALALLALPSQTATDTQRTPRTRHPEDRCPA